MTDDHDTTDPLADDAQATDQPDDGSETGNALTDDGSETGNARTDDPGRAIADGDVADPTDPAETAGGAGTDADDGWLDSGVERKLKGAGAVVLGLIATWATFQVYFSLSRSIEIWFSRDFVPVFQAAFNLIVVLVAVAGIVWLVRELS